MTDVEVEAMLNDFSEMAAEFDFKADFINDESDPGYAAWREASAWLDEAVVEHRKHLDASRKLASPGSSSGGEDAQE